MEWLTGAPLNHCPLTTKRTVADVDWSIEKWHHSSSVHAVVCSHLSVTSGFIALIACRTIRMYPAAVWSAAVDNTPWKNRKMNWSVPESFANAGWCVAARCLLRPTTKRGSSICKAAARSRNKELKDRMKLCNTKGKLVVLLFMVN